MNNAQKMITDVKDFLLKQGERATNAEGTGCRYRGQNKATMCAVGCLIPDELYDSGMEGLGASDLNRDYPEVVKVIRDKYQLSHFEALFWLQRLQAVHDFHIPIIWEAKFNDLIVEAGDKP